MNNFKSVERGARSGKGIFGRVGRVGLVGPAVARAMAGGLVAVFAVGVAACFLPGCASLDPGADPIVVRAEQAQAFGKSSFDLILNEDNADRGFWRTNAPAFHDFCEWLRQPMTVQVTNTLPRAAAMLVGLDQVKLDYKASRVSSNALFEAIITMESATREASAWVTVANAAKVKTH